MIELRLDQNFRLDRDFRLSLIKCLSCVIFWCWVRLSRLRFRYRIRILLDLGLFFGIGSDFADRIIKVESKFQTGSGL